MEKIKYVYCLYKSLNVDFFDGALDDVIKEFQLIKDRILELHPDAIGIRVNSEQSWNTINISVSYFRPESEAEIKKRKEREAKAQKKKTLEKVKLEEHERKEYERLKSKFG